MSARLLEKLIGETDTVRAHYAQREKHLMQGRGAAAGLKRQNTKLIRDDYNDIGYADPADVGYIF
mgnify:FL=1